MIYSIRGTGGSGKSTLIRKVISSVLVEPGPRILTPHYSKGRKQPLYYTIERSLTKGLAIIGHYETPCGGCDTISDGYEYIFNLVRSLHDKGYDVIFEGLLITLDAKWTIKAKEAGYDIQCLFLDTSLEQCLTNTNLRRKAKNPEAKSVNPKNTEAKKKGVPNCIRRLAEAGVSVTELSFAEAYQVISKGLCIEEVELDDQHK